MYRLLAILTLLSLPLISCIGGNVRENTCPDGEPTFVPAKLEHALPGYMDENQLVMSQTEELLTKIQPSPTVEERVVKLRQDLELERIDLETGLKSTLVALEMKPCGTATRNHAWTLLGDINTKTKEMPDRVKQLNDR